MIRKRGCRIKRRFGSAGLEDLRDSVLACLGCVWLRLWRKLLELYDHYTIVQSAKVWYNLNISIVVKRSCKKNKFKRTLIKLPRMAVKGKQKRRIMTEYETQDPQISHRSAPPNLGCIYPILTQVKWFPASRNYAPVPGVRPQEVDSAEHPLPKRWCGGGSP